MSEPVTIEWIDADPAYQLRAAMDAEWIDEMAASLMADGSLDLPPIDLWQVVGHDRPKVGDGFHRLAAYRKAGRATIPAIVHDEASELDLFRFALLANRNHGLRLTNEDKRRKAEAALEWWPERSSRELARETGLSHTFFDGLRKKARVDRERQAAAAAHERERADRERQLVHEVEQEAAKASLAGVHQVELAELGQVDVAALAADGRRAIPPGAAPGAAGTYLYMAAKTMATQRRAASEAFGARSGDYLSGWDDYAKGDPPARGRGVEYVRGYREARDFAAANPAVVKPTAPTAPAAPVEPVPEPVEVPRAAETFDLQILEAGDLDYYFEPQPLLLISGPREAIAAFCKVLGVGEAITMTVADGGLVLRLTTP